MNSGGSLKSVKSGMIKLVEVLACRVVALCPASEPVIKFTVGGGISNCCHRLGMDLAQFNMSVMVVGRMDVREIFFGILRATGISFLSAKVARTGFSIVRFLFALALNKYMGAIKEVSWMCFFFPVAVKIGGVSNSDFSL